MSSEDGKIETLRLVEDPAVREIDRDPGRPEGMAADLCLNPGCLRLPLDHMERVGARLTGSDPALS